MPLRRTECRDCGADLLIVQYVPDRARTAAPAGRGRPSFMPLDAAPAARDDDYASYGVSAGKTRAHLITDEWPLLPDETRHTTHHATCPRRSRAPEVVL